MAVPDPFLTAAIAFLVGCSSMYKDGAVPTNVTLHTVNFDDGKVKMFLYENKVKKEEKELTDGVTKNSGNMDDIQVQMEEKDGKLVVAGQGFLGAACRPFHLDDQNKIIGVLKWTTSSENVFYMMNGKMYNIRCKDSDEKILDSVLRDLNGKLLNNETVKQSAVECRTDIGVDSAKKVFVFEKDGCKQLGDDMKTWTQPAASCTKDKILLKRGVKSPLYSLRYLLTVYGSDCKEKIGDLSSQGRWVDNTYVKLTVPVSKTVANSTKEEVGKSEPPNMVMYIGIGAGVVVVIIIIAIIIIIYTRFPGMLHEKLGFCESMKERIREAKEKKKGKDGVTDVEAPTGTDGAAPSAVSNVGSTVSKVQDSKAGEPPKDEKNEGNGEQKEEGNEGNGENGENGENAANGENGANGEEEQQEGKEEKKDEKKEKKDKKTDKKEKKDKKDKKKDKKTKKTKKEKKDKKDKKEKKGKKEDKKDKKKKKSSAKK